MAVNKDKLASSLADELNKKYKGGKIAFFLNDESTPQQATDTSTMETKKVKDTSEAFDELFNS